MSKSIDYINKKIKEGNAVVLTAEEMIDVVEKEGGKEAAKIVDVVTTGTFGPMCSSGAYFNIKQTKPKIKLGGGSVKLNNVPAYAGFAAADLFLGCTAVPDGVEYNKDGKSDFKYGGAHVIEDLVAGKEIQLEGKAYGTDCYPNRNLKTSINIKDINDAVLFNPRNAYQNYNVAVNASDETIYTYMGTLRPNFANANFCSAGQLSPLLNDPYYKTMGIGTRVFLGGGIGYISWWGTQHNPNVSRGENGVPRSPAGTLALIGDLKNMSPEWLKGLSFTGYGTSLGVGVGVPIPILNEEIANYTAVRDRDIYAQIVDYSNDYPNGIPNSLGEVNYEQLRSGKIEFRGNQIPTACFSNYKKARKIAETLKDWINKGDFLLSNPVEKLPGVKKD